MATGNAIYPLWKQVIMREPLQPLPTTSSLDQNTVTNGPYLALVDLTTYVYSEAHQFYSEVVAAQQGVPVRLTDPTVNGRVFDANDVVFTNVTGTLVGAVVIYRNNPGPNNTWRLVLYEDTGITGVPLAPSGGNILVTWNTQGIFGL